MRNDPRPYIAAATLALWLQGAAWIAGGVLTLWHGPPGLLALALLVGFARLARPPLPPSIADRLKPPH